MNNLFGANLTFADSLFVTAVCMATVFIVLWLISGLLSLFKYIPADKATEIKKVTPKSAPVSNNKVEETSFNPDNIKDENMIVAMLVASIEAAEENEGAFIKVRNIKEI